MLIEMHNFNNEVKPFNDIIQNTLRTLSHWYNKWRALQVARFFPFENHLNGNFLREGYK